LEALKLFSVGQDEHRVSNFAEAKADYEKAIRIDSNFAAAKGALGVLLFEQFDREEGKRLLSDAIQHVDNLADREKYQISAFYAVAIENDLAKGIELEKLMLALHPDEWGLHNNVGWYSFQLGRGEAAVSEYKEALRLDPYSMISYNRLITVYLHLIGDMDAALDFCRKQIAYDDHVAFAHQNMGSAFLGKGDFATAQQSFQRSLELEPNSTDARYLIGYTYLLQGRYRDAINAFLSIQHYNPAKYQLFYDAGLACEMAADPVCARDNFKRFVAQVSDRIKQNSGDTLLRLELAKGLIRIGRAAEGRAEGRAAMQADPEKHFEIAQFLNADEKTDEALDHLELGAQSGMRDFLSVKIQPDFLTLRNVARFQRLLSAHLNGVNSR
jgi:tetratricopeptide (TPR) repeat protein